MAVRTDSAGEADVAAILGIGIILVGNMISEGLTVWMVAVAPGGTAGTSDGRQADVRISKHKNKIVKNAWGVGDIGAPIPSPKSLSRISVTVSG
jgi:hypothetical protein